jgi:hypothetical protein
VITTATSRRRPPRCDSQLYSSVQPQPAHTARGVATWFDKLAVRCEVTVHVASINIWLRDLERHIEHGPEPYRRPLGSSTEAVQRPVWVNVTCVTPLGEEVASTW